MRRQGIAAVMIATLMLGALAVPAAASPVPTQTGVISGTAVVGKLGTCSQTGAGAVAGAGLGISWLSGKKNAWYVFTAALTSLVKGNGVLNLCGKLGPTLDNVKHSLGAACDASKGWDGKGTIVTVAGTDWLTDVEWKLSVGTFKVVTGDVHDVKGGKNGGELVAFVRAAGNLSQFFNCFSKPIKRKHEGNANTKTGGLTTFDVFAIYAILGVQGDPIDQNQPIITCKNDNDPACLWGTKKEPKPL